MALPYVTEYQLLNLQKKTEFLNKQLQLVYFTSEEQTADVLNSLDNSKMSDLLTTNVDKIMESAGIAKDEESYDLYQKLYDKLQNGEKISADLSDGTAFSMGGQFSEDSGRWSFDFDLKLPESGTGAILNNGYILKGGNLQLTTDSGEIIKDKDFGAIIGIYGYKLSLTGVTVINGYKKFTLDITDLTLDESFDYGLVIDPNRMDWTITIRDFRLPEAGAAGTVKLNGEAVSWDEVRKLLK